MPKVASLTCQEITPNTTVDDHLAFDIIRNKGIEVEEVIWDQEKVWSEYDLVLIRTTWDYMYKVELFKEVLAEIQTQTTLLNPLSTILWNMNKKYLFDLEQLGIPTITSEFHQTLSLNQVHSRLKKTQYKNGLIIKPCIGGSSHGIQLLKKSEEFKAVEPGEWLIQPFLPQIQETGEYSIIFFNNQFSHAINKLPQKNDFRSQEEYGSLISAWQPDRDCLELCRNILNTIPYSQSYARIDLIKDNSGFKLIELELIEPCLFLHYEPNQAPKNFANMIIKTLGHS